MNENTEMNINEAIDWLQQTGGAIQDFAVEQAPLYCREVVAWEFWYGMAGCLGGLLLLTVGGLLLRKGFAITREGKGKGLSYCEREDPFGWMGSAILLLVLGTILSAGSATKAIKAAVAPRLVIVEHLKGLRK